MVAVTSITHPKKRAFLAAFSECGTVLHAAEAAGITRKTHYDWLAKDAEYAAAVPLAEAEAAERLEREARRRAVEGVDEPITYQGQVTGTVKKYSDVLLIFLLKGALPQKYRDVVRTELANAPGQTLELGIRANLAALSTEDLRELSRSLRAALAAPAAVTKTEEGSDG